MELKVLGSSSKGNCYILDNGKEALIIEAGISLKEVKKSLGYNIRKVEGCLVTHQHNDHARYIGSMVGAGFHTLALPEVWKAKEVWDSRSVSIVPGKGYRLGRFKVMPFPACHDVPCVGWLIQHPEIGLLMFLTDSYMCEYTFPGLNHVMVECNYCDASLTIAIAEGRTRACQRERLMTSHMELENCKELLKANDLSKVSEIILLHLSENNSDGDRFIDEIQKVTGKAVYIAKPGFKTELSNLW